MKTYRNWLLFSILIVGLSSCYKDTIDFNQYAPLGDKQSFFQEVQTLEESYPASSSEQYIVMGDSLLLYIPEGSFVNESGDIVEGGIEIEITKVEKKGVMVLYENSTISDGRLLDTRASYNITAKQEDAELMLADGKDLIFRLYDSNPQEWYELFQSNGQPGTAFNWEEVDENPDSWATVSVESWDLTDPSTQQVYEGSGYQFALSELGEFSVSKLLEMEAGVEKTGVCLQLPEIYIADNTVVYMMFADSQTAVQLFVTGQQKNTFCTTDEIYPVGEEINFVIISSQGDEQYHMEVKNKSIEADHWDYLVLEEKSLAEILDVLGMF